MKPSKSPEENLPHSESLSLFILGPKINSGFKINTNPDSFGTQLMCLEKKIECFEANHTFRSTFRFTILNITVRGATQTRFSQTKSRKQNMAMAREHCTPLFTKGTHPDALFRLEQFSIF